MGFNIIISRETRCEICYLNFQTRFKNFSVVIWRTANHIFVTNSHAYVHQNLIKWTHWLRLRGLFHHLYKPCMSQNTEFRIKNTNLSCACTTYYDGVKKRFTPFSNKFEMNSWTVLITMAFKKTGTSSNTIKLENWKATNKFSQ